MSFFSRFGVQYAPSHMDFTTRTTTDDSQVLVLHEDGSFNDSSTETDEGNAAAAEVVDIDIVVQEEDDQKDQNTSQIRRVLKRKREDFQSISDKLERQARNDTFNMTSPFQYLKDNLKRSVDYGAAMSTIAKLIAEAPTHLSTTALVIFKDNLPEMPTDFEQAQAAVKRIMEIMETLWGTDTNAQVIHRSAYDRLLKQMREIQRSCETDREELAVKARRIELQQARLLDELSIVEEDLEDVEKFILFIRATMSAKSCERGAWEAGYAPVKWTLKVDRSLKK